jgi:hypothetical protein
MTRSGNQVNVYSSTSWAVVREPLSSQAKLADAPVLPGTPLKESRRRVRGKMTFRRVVEEDTMTTSSSTAGSRRWPASRPALGMIAAAATWMALVVVILFTSLLLGWILLGIALLGSGPAPGGQPVPAMLLALLALASGLAWLTAQYIASWRGVGLVIAVVLTLGSLVGATWALSSPDQALYLAREDGSARRPMIHKRHREARRNALLSHPRSITGNYGDVG